MSKQTWLRLDGSLEQGFRVSIDIRNDSKFHAIEAEGELPANPDLTRYLKEWQQSYEQLAGARRIVLDNVIIEMINPREDCLQKRDALERCFKDWLLSGSFRAIERQIQGQVSPSDELRIVIRAKDSRLHHLPWHLWDLVEDDYKYAEVALGMLAKPLEKVREPGAKVKILAILGDSEGIDTQSDCQQLEQLPNADVTFLPEKSRQVINDHLWDQDWDILFFAGHGRTEKPQDDRTERPKGRIYINSKDSLTIKELKYGLERAIARGLQLAIFNSCDGLGLAYELEQLQIPQLIVMREPVPDRVAQEFLKRFLTAFAEEGESLYAAVRCARERLAGLEGEFPCASWLPMIVQNPAVVPPVWADLWHSSPEPLSVPKRSTRFWRRLLTVMATSAVVTGVVMGVRSMGWLQAWELPVYDKMMRLRPSESGQDKRILVITIDNDDIVYQQRQGWKRRWSLSDEALNLLLSKLEKRAPWAIGLDIERDAPVDPSQSDLAKRLKTDDRFVVGCAVRVPGDQLPGTAPPPEVPQIERQGFANVVLDSDGIARRHLLSMDIFPESPCKTPYALSTMLAFYYLHHKGIAPEFTKDGDLKLGRVEFERLRPLQGGYSDPDTRGNQILLNYRSYNSPQDIVDTASLTQVLTDKISPEFIEKRVILIGVVDAKDRFSTPYSIGRAPHQQIPGVILHAQMVSQLLSAVLDNRPLLKSWLLWQEGLWCLGWSSVGGFLVLCLRVKLHLGIFGVSSLVILIGISYILLLAGYWVPVVVPALTMIVTGSFVLICKESAAKIRFSEKPYIH
jgi:CHASE2 domain-containing sensor protein